MGTAASRHIDHSTQNKAVGKRKSDSKLYGCMFPGSLCHTQTETNGNAPCSLILLLYFSMLLVTNNVGMYK